MRVRCPKCGEAVDLGGLSVGICDCGAKVRLPQRPPPVPMKRGSFQEVSAPAIGAPPPVEAALKVGELVEPEVNDVGDASPWMLRAGAPIAVGRAIATAVVVLASLYFVLLAMGAARFHGPFGPAALWVIAAVLCWILVSLGWLRDAVRERR